MSVTLTKEHKSSRWQVFSSGDWEAACDTSSPWALREQRQPSSVNLQTIYTRLNVSHDSTKSTASRYVTVSAHFHPGLVLQLDSASNLQVSYQQILTGRPRLKHDHRQEGIPPSWSADSSVCADRLQVAKENAFAWRKWVVLRMHLPVPAHVIACDLVSCRLYIAQGLYGGVLRCAPRRIWTRLM